MVTRLPKYAEFERNLQCDVLKDETLTCGLDNIFCVIRERKFLVFMTRDLNKTRSMMCYKKESEKTEDWA